jgi:hypothetical protein
VSIDPEQRPRRWLADKLPTLRHLLSQPPRLDDGSRRRLFRGAKRERFRRYDEMSKAFLAELQKLVAWAGVGGTR